MRPVALLVSFLPHTHTTHTHIPYTHMHTHTHAYTHTPHTHTHTHSHAHTHAHTHTHTHTLHTGILLLLASITLSLAAASDDVVTSLNNVITQRDKARLRQLVILAEPYTEAQTAYYVASGLQLLGPDDSDLQVSCNYNSKTPILGARLSTVHTD